MDQTHHAIGYVEISVTDMGRARAFYEAAFGWEFNDYGPEYSGIRSPDGEGEVGGLGRGPAVGRRRRRSCCSTRSTSTPPSRRSRAAGGTITEEPYEFPGGRRFFFADPDGNVLGVYQLAG